MSRLCFSTSPTIWAPPSCCASSSWRPRARPRPWPNSSERSCTPGPKRESSSSGSPRSWRASWPGPTISRPLGSIFELAIGLDSSAQSVLQSALATHKSNAAVSPWLKDSYALEEVPGGLEGPLRAQFEQAMGWARDGLWDPAAAAFELLSADRAAGHAADHNLGLCRLWLGDDGAAIAALRRWIAREGPTTRAVDLEIVCQLIDKSTGKEPIEEVQLIWPLLDRSALSRILEREATIVEGEKRHVDPEDDKSPEVACFHWLDRPRIKARTGLARQEIPLIQADVLVGPDTVVLEAHDDGRLNGLIDRFAALAGRSVAPGHPRMKVIGQVDRTEHAMSWHWYLPPICRIGRRGGSRANRSHT